MKKSADLALQAYNPTINSTKMPSDANQVSEINATILLLINSYSNGTTLRFINCGNSVLSSSTKQKRK